MDEIDIDAVFGGASTTGPNPKILELMSLWRNEVLSPVILPYNKELVDYVREKLRAQQENIDSVVGSINVNDENNSDAVYFKSTLHQMDIERVRYSLSRYLRARILKIEDTLEAVMHEDYLLDRLSDEEQVFASQLQHLKNRHFEDTVYSKVSEECQQLLWGKGGKRNGSEVANVLLEHAQPQYDDFVIVRALRRVSLNVAELGDDPIDFEDGSITALPFRAVEAFVIDKTFELV